MPSAASPPIPTFDPSWIPAARVRNHVLGDPILDWLEAHGERHGFVRDDHADHGYMPETDFSRFVMERGREFEAGVVRLVDGILKERGLPPVVRVACSAEDVASGDCLRHTLDLMSEGVPVIHQGVLWDGERGTYGAPDLLVRSDVLDLLACGSLAQAGASVNAPLLGDEPWHYVVVDVKFSTLHLNAAGEVGNDGSAPAYKAQLALYNAALGALQGYTPPAAFLIGRGWMKGDERGSSCLERVGRVTIDQPQFRAENVDWLDMALQAAAWLGRVGLEGGAWTVGASPSVPELRPNMKHVEDAPWHRAKRAIAQETGELTAVWEVGPSMRDAFHLQHGLSDWRDPRVTVQLLAPFDGRGHLWSKKTGALADKGVRLAQMLAINREGCDDVVRPAVVATEREEWATTDEIEFFVDFETCSDLDDDFSRLPEKNGQALIFMVGCGHYEDGEWRFRAFTAERLDPESEGQVLADWTRHMEEVRARLAPGLVGPKVFHWSPAETSTLTEAYNSAATRHRDLRQPNWYDFLNRVVKPKGSAPCVVVRGAMGFGLKAIGKALKSQGLIETGWEDGPTDGLGAMTGAWWCYREAAARGASVFDVSTHERDGCPCRELMREIRDYNEVDCRVMAEVIGYLRRCH